MEPSVSASQGLMCPRRVVSCLAEAVNLSLECLPDNHLGIQATNHLEATHLVSTGQMVINWGPEIRGEPGDI